MKKQWMELAYCEYFGVKCHSYGYKNVVKNRTKLSFNETNY